MLERSIEEIINQALENNIFGQSFEFRKGQREVVEQIVKAYQEDPESTVVIDAPTGTGKSLIAMWSSYILKELGKRGYLVTSDLALQDQYEKDFKRLSLNWPSIRGVDNYECFVNSLPFSLGDCKMKGMSYEQAEQLSCYGHCGYLQNRRRAIEQPVALLNYSFWLIQRNYVQTRMDEQEREAPFKKRDFVFFDEAHKVDEIVQNHFSARIDESIIDRVVYLNRFISRHNIPAETQTKNRLQAVVHDLMTIKGREPLFKAIQEFRGIAITYRAAQDIAKKTAKKRFGQKTIPSDWASAFTAFDRLKDVYCKFDDYSDLIKDVGLEAMVIDQREDEARFTCVEESKMIQKYLHEQAGFKVFMSATIGDPRAYARIMGIKGARFIRMDNSFSFEKSPIIFVNRHKLTYREREASLPKVVKILDQIIKKHKGQRGIIHSGSYQFTEYIKRHSMHTFRLMDYEGSKEKAEMLELFEQREDSIIMGPSLLEGLDMKDGMSRFQIFFKVPYPSLADPLIKAKLNISNDWYNWKTGVQLQQGVGRSVRSVDDWAITYVIDASFMSLINKPDFFPPSFKERIKIVK
jgi:ATP-dependent DNA helicase DinG